jgi:hypothetical protein
MSWTRQSRIVTVGIYAVAILLLVNVLVMLGGRGSHLLPAAWAQRQPPIAGGAGVFVMPAQIAQNMWGCYLLDVDSGTLCVYQYFPGAKQLQLLAARDYKWDRRLPEFNTSPSPQEIKELVEKMRKSAATEHAPN